MENLKLKAARGYEIKKVPGMRIWKNTETEEISYKGGKIHFLFSWVSRDGGAWIYVTPFVTDEYGIEHVDNNLFMEYNGKKKYSYTMENINKILKEVTGNNYNLYITVN